MSFCLLKQDPDDFEGEYFEKYICLDCKHLMIGNKYIEATLCPKCHSENTAPLHA
jgi:uncharacterized CHY-type Zn-finger protein